MADSDQSHPYLEGVPGGPMPSPKHAPEPVPTPGHGWQPIAGRARREPNRLSRRWMGMHLVHREDRTVKTHTKLLALVAASIVVAACGGSAATPSLSPAPPVPTPSPSPSPATAGADFTIEVLPAAEPAEGRPAIPGEKVVFLVVVTSPGTDQPVKVGATVKGGTVDRISPAELKPGVVGEVWIVPGAATEETRITTEITASRAGVTRTASRTTVIMPFEDDRAPQAQPYFDLWVGWLAANHPEFGITTATRWESSFVLALLIVGHYAYFSDDW
jgi:hypothetical protein